MFKEYPDVVSVEQLMEMLQIGQSLAYRLLRSGAIHAKKSRAKIYHRKGQRNRVCLRYL